MEDILKAPPGCLLLVTSYEAKLIDCDKPLVQSLPVLLKMQSMKEKKRCVEKKRVGSTKKRVHPNVTQQYIPRDDSLYTIIMIYQIKN